MFERYLRSPRYTVDQLPFPDTRITHVHKALTRPLFSRELACKQLVNSVKGGSCHGYFTDEPTEPVSAIFALLHDASLVS